MPIEIDLDNSRANPADYIKQDESETSELVLNIIPKNPQIPHVSQEVNKPTMKKHVAQKGEIGIEKRRTGNVRCGEHLDGNETELKYEGIQPGTC